MKVTPLFLSPSVVLLCFPFGSVAQVESVQELAPGVFFHQGDNSRGHSNNGWVLFDDYVLVVDANYPSGAHIVMPKIAATSDLPVRILVDTHHHADHAYGNRLWAEAGALLFAHVGVITEMNEREPADWNARAPSRPDMQTTSLQKPSVLFDRDLYFDDNTRRVELHWFGVAHTRGDGFVWLPEQKILFTGDAAVNGPYNNVRDGNIGAWIKTLDAARQLGAEIVAPGHGPAGGPEIIENQQLFFKELLARANALRNAGETPAQAKAAAGAIREEMAAMEKISLYVGGGLTGQLEKAWTELGGGPFPE